MIKKLIKHGNSYAIIIDKPILELLKIQEDTPLEIITLDGKSLNISPIGKDYMEKSLDVINKKFGKTLMNLEK